jgi:phosphoenolpyruvate-protein kinase (PTS system EI component)
MSIAATGVSPGRAAGPIVVVAARRSEPVEDPVCALELVAEELEGLAGETGGEVGEILIAQAAIARDPQLAAGAEARMTAGDGPRDALRVSAEPFLEALRASRGDYQRQRAQDVEEVVRRAVGHMAGMAEGERRPPVPGILASASVSPAETAAIPAGQLLGIVSAEGGENSHAAIVARSLGIPAIVGLSAEELEGLAPGRWVEIDGDRGTIETAGDAASWAYPPTAAFPADGAEAAPRPPANVRANIGSIAEADAAAAAGLQAAGLIRTEFLLAEREALEPARQQALYAEIAERIAGPLVFRLLDVGADKPHPGIPPIESRNPALGVRGVRLLLREPNLLRAQLEALCRLDEAERVSVLIPMVARLDELLALREIADSVFSAEGVRLPVGTMIEIPSAALDAARLAASSDFLSIGTNDLIQYLFAADRGLAELDRIPEPLPPPVWQLLADVIAAGRRAGIEVGVCGELGADPEAGGALLAMGASYVSVGPGSAASVGTALGARGQVEWSELAARLAERD